MKISQEVREYAEERQIGDPQKAHEEWMQEKSGEFMDKGGKIY